MDDWLLRNHRSFWPVKQAGDNHLSRAKCNKIYMLYIYIYVIRIYIYIIHSSNEGTNMHLAASKKIEQSFTVI